MLYIAGSKLSQNNLVNNNNIIIKNNKKHIYTGKLHQFKEKLLPMQVLCKKSKKHEGSGNELVDYSKAPSLGADQKTRGLWERDWQVYGYKKAWKQRARFGGMTINYYNPPINFRVILLATLRHVV